MTVPAFAFDLEGTVKLEPPLPEAAWLEVPEKHQADCGSKKLSPKLQVSPEGLVANAVVKLEGNLPVPQTVPGTFEVPGTIHPIHAIVKVEGIPAGGPELTKCIKGDTSCQSPTSPVLDQTHCEFSPHVLLLPAGGTLTILNSEAMLHNVRAFNEKTEMLFNDAMPKKGQVLKKRFNEAGRIVVRCGIHHWMHALLIVTEHPFYAVTDEKGYFKIEGIPEGTYSLSVWHETLGEIKAEISPNTKAFTLTYQRLAQQSNVQ